MIMETPFFQAPNLFTWGLKAVLSYAKIYKNKVLYEIEIQEMELH